VAFCSSCRVFASVSSPSPSGSIGPSLNPKNGAAFKLQFVERSLRDEGHLVGERQGLGAIAPSSSRLGGIHDTRASVLPGRQPDRAHSGHRDSKPRGRA
jgi:hypothetical protein